jgi:uncharacterized protein YndB with AHSA1/START domain
MLKIILIVIGVIMALVLILAAVMDKEYSISTEIIINKPKSKVFSYIKNIRNQEKYSKWVMADPNVKLVYTGTDGEVGFKSSWNSEVSGVGVGEQEITRVVDGVEIHVEIRFEKPFKMVSRAISSTQEINENQTKYTNVFYTRSPYPMNIMVPLMKKILGKDMNETSRNLKEVLEKN